nr:MAG: capsid protein [Cressdnaviricota sp.]
MPFRRSRSARSRKPRSVRRRPRSVRRIRRAPRMPLRRAPRSRATTGLMMGHRKFVRLNFQTYVPQYVIVSSGYAPTTPAYPQYGGYAAGNQVVWNPMNATPDSFSPSGIPTIPGADDNVWNGMTQFAQYFSNARLHSATLRVRLTFEGVPSGAAGSTHSVRAVLIALPMTLDGSNAFAANTPDAISQLTWSQLRSAMGVRTCILTTPTGGKSTRVLRASGSTKRLFDKSSIRDDPGGLNAVQLSTTLVSADWKNPENVWGFVLNIYSDSPSPIADTASAAAAAWVTIDAKLTGVWELYNRILITEPTLSS